MQNSAPKNPERILGIDPGFGRLGYGVIERTKGNDWKMLTYGCVDTSPKHTIPERLHEIFLKIQETIVEYRVTRLAVEELFFFKNAKTVIGVAEARGVILLCGAERGLPIDELTPLQVKQALTGSGRADKDQVEKMVGILLGIKKKITPDDAADALAIALAAGQRLWLSQLESRQK